MKPEVICHIMSSVDGRLLPSAETRPHGIVWIRYKFHNNKQK